MDSPLTRTDLDALHIPAGEVFGKIFKATRGLARDEAMAVAISIRDGTWLPPAHESRAVKVGTILHHLLNVPFIPSTSAPNPMWASKSEVRRMLEQGAIRINWETDWKADEPVPDKITELTMFPTGNRIAHLVCLSCAGKEKACAGHLDEAVEAHKRGIAIVLASKMRM